MTGLTQFSQQLLLLAVVAELGTKFKVIQEALAVAVEEEIQH
jgi:hypothetical protein